MNQRGKLEPEIVGGTGRQTSIAEKEATKPWYAKDNVNGMRNAVLSHRKERLSAKFTLSGKRQGGVPRARELRDVAAAAIFILILATPANARPETGPTSSASISISVSVVPRFGLRASESSARRVPGTSDDAAFCIATNGEPSALPVLLITGKAGEDGVQGPAEGEPLRRCDPGAGLARTGRAPGSGNANWMVVYPE